MIRRLGLQHIKWIRKKAKIGNESDERKEIGNKGRKCTISSLEQNEKRRSNLKLCPNGIFAWLEMFSI